MKHVCSLFFASLFCLPLAYSQISFTSSDVLNLIGTSITHQGSFEDQEGIGPGIAGSDQTWALDTISTDTSITMTWTFMAPNNTPFADSFPQANFVQVLAIGDSGLSSLDYDFALVMDTAYISVGSASISTFGELIDTSFSYTNETAVFLPLTYGRSWKVTEIDSSEYEGITEVSMDTSEFMVDAYGSVTVGTGTYDCLRLRNTNRTSSFSILDSVHMDTSASVEVFYLWLAKEVFFAAQMIGPENDLDPNFTSASTFLRLIDVESPEQDTSGTDSTATSLPSLLEVVQDVQLSPNPAHSEITLSFSLPEKMQLDVAIYDLRGKKVHTLVQSSLMPGKYAYSWEGKMENGELISPGWYVAVLQSGERGHAIKFLWRP